MPPILKKEVLIEGGDFLVEEGFKGVYEFFGD